MKQTHETAPAQSMKSPVRRYGQGLFLTAIALSFFSFQAMAQFSVYGLSGGAGSSAVGNPLVSSNSIIIGNATSASANNVFIGNNTGTMNNTFGIGNVFVGAGTGNANSGGYANTFLGSWSGASNTTGIGNTFVGQWSAPANVTGSHNVFVGQGSGSSSITGHDNVFVGQGGGNTNTSGRQNVFLGTAGGINNTTGENNIAIGYYAGFTSGGLNNSTVIGANAVCSAANAMILGPDGTGGTTRVNVGIGTGNPAAHLHTETPITENILFSTTGMSTTSSTTVKLSTGILPTLDAAKLFMNHRNYSGTLLNPLGAPTFAPAIPLSDMAGLLTDGASLAIGMDGYELDKTGSIHFINYVGSNRTECMRINEANGFVGVHTRSSNGTGAPQALFHVNLENPAGNITPTTQGIRFQGLPYAPHDSVVVIDAQGNLAKAPYGGSTSETDPLSWHLTGNSVNPTEFFGTTNPDDIRIRTSGTPRGRITADGNFDFGGNTVNPGTATSATVGTNNTLDGPISSIATGTANTIRNSEYSVAFGEGNTIDISSSSSQATGYGNRIEETEYSIAVGKENEIKQLSREVLAAGTHHSIRMSYSVAALGGRDTIISSDESVVAGEDNKLRNAHGSFIGGGHNYVNGSYDFVGGSYNTINGSHIATLGHYLEGDLAGSTPVASQTADPNTYMVLIGERINSNLKRSASVGFNGNRTTVTTERGMSVQIDPTSGNTDQPVVNFEVEAGVTTTGRQGIGTVRSNIRFHNLPPEPNGNSLPAVLIDPTTGELFRSQNLYMKPGRGSSEADLDSMYKENEALKNRVSQLESQLTMFDEKFAQLERSLNQICEKGCAGLDNINSDVLYQSVPNPTDNSTVVNYYLARNYAEASIALYSIDGREVRTYTLNPAKGDGSVNVVLGDVLPGTYLYRLIVDGKPVAVKKMQKQ